jgi:DNA invertase Pin-like site-specific DNA recombinase
MMRSPKLTPERLSRRAVIYVRQSSLAQVLGNLESQRRQYELAQLARDLGFDEVLTIDDDQGRTASGKANRPGFLRLVAELATGNVGAVFCLEASRLARNGRDWHKLLEVCAASDAVIAGPEGVYDPSLGDDRLFLGLKGTFSEYELNVMHQRARGAIEAKAKRGEFRFALQVGLCWSVDEKIELNPDQRVQDAIRLVYRKYEELGSMRQATLWFRHEGIMLPTRRDSSEGPRTEWAPPRAHTISRILRSPLYAGAYVWGRTTTAPGSKNVIFKPQAQWRVLLKDHHPGYITWDDYLRLLKMMADNAHRVKTGVRKAGRGGQALLAGLLRCRRCGRRLRTLYSSAGRPKYHCAGQSVLGGEPCVVAFGGPHPQEVISAEILAAAEQPALDAAKAAAKSAERQRTDRLKAAELELEQARYQALLSERRYEHVDPANRLVAPELERRWEAALNEVVRLEFRLVQLQEQPEPQIDIKQLQRLATQLPQVWHDDRANAGVKQRIVRTLIEEIIVDVDLSEGLVLMTIHWKGGRHSVVEAKRRRQNRRAQTTTHSAREIVRRMGIYWDDRTIASTLNRLGLKTGRGLTWTSTRVKNLRNRHGMTEAKLKVQADQRPAVALMEASEHLGISTISVRKLIRLGSLPAEQVVPYAPWRILAADLNRPEVQAAAAEIKARNARKPARRPSRNLQSDNQTLMIPGV